MSGSGRNRHSTSGASVSATAAEPTLARTNVFPQSSGRALAAVLMTRLRAGRPKVSEERPCFDRRVQVGGPEFPLFFAELDIPVP